MRPGAKQCLAERDQRRIIGARRGGADSLGGRFGRSLASAAYHLEQLIGAFAPGSANAPYAGELAPRCGLALGELHQRGVTEDALDRAVVARRRALAPLDQLASHRPRRRAETADPRQPSEDRVEVPLVARVLERLALLACPLKAPDRRKASLKLRGQLEQVHDVLAGVRELLRGERPCVPAGEACRLGHAETEDLSQQRLVGGLRPEPSEPCRDLRVEHVGQLGREAPAQERDVLAPGVHHDLDRRIGEDRRERRAVEIVRERVEEHDPLPRIGLVGDRQLDQAEERAVAALAHELRVQGQPPRGARPVGEGLETIVLYLQRHELAAPGSSHRILW